VEDQFVVEGAFHKGLEDLRDEAHVDIWQSSPGPTFHVYVWDSRVLDTWGTATYTPPVPGAPLKLRLRLDQFGIRAKLWAAADPEPADWLASMLGSQPVATAWTPTWLAVTPSQATPTALGPQSFSIDSIRVMEGWP